MQSGGKVPSGRPGKGRWFARQALHAACAASLRGACRDRGPGPPDPANSIMAAEDFAFVLEAKSGCHTFIGNGDGEYRDEGHGQRTCLVHNTSYDFNDGLLPLGATYRRAGARVARAGGARLTTAVAAQLMLGHDFQKSVSQQRPISSACFRVQ